MISRIEELAMNAWPSLQSNMYDGWVLRFSGGYTKRANSINPIYLSTVNVDEKIKFCQDIYRSKGLNTVFKMTKASQPKELDSILESKGYIKNDETSVRLLDLSLCNFTSGKGLCVENEFTQEWIDSFVDCADIREKATIEVMGKMLNSIIGEKICARIKIDNEVVACGFGIIEDNYIGIFDIIVSQKNRGKGFGKELMQGILMEAHKKAIPNAYLQVVVGNSIAENLYEKLGFKEVYRYWYRISI